MRDKVIDYRKPLSFDNESYRSDDSNSGLRKGFDHARSESDSKVFLDDNTSRAQYFSSCEMGKGSAISDFTGADCGEPFVPQRLVVDFTPIPGDEEVYTKCRDFWNYVYSRPELRQYKVYQPVPVPVPRRVPVSPTDLKEDEDLHSELIDWLTDDKVITETTFATMRRCGNYCGDSSASYSIEIDEWKSGKETAMSNHTQARPQNKQVKAMCSEMAAFDEAHPRSFEPPSAAHALHHALLRKIST